MPLKFHVSQTPYIDAYGARRACYDLLNARGYSVAALSLVDGQVDRLLALAGLAMDSFIAQARAHAEQTPALRFT